jgi:pseudolysin
MKLKTVKMLFKKTAIALCLSHISVSYAADQQIVWGKIDNYKTLLQSFTVKQTNLASQNLRLPTNLNPQKNSINTLEFVRGYVDETNTSHVRYSQHYLGLPVWGGEISFHISAKKNVVTGTLINAIQLTSKDLNVRVSLDQAKEIALDNQVARSPINAQKIIFFDRRDSNKAIVAYRISFLSQTLKGPSIPSYIIDANTGKILHQWNSLAEGDGRGGILRVNEYDFAYPQGGKHSFGGIPTNWSPEPNSCDQTTNFSEIISLNNKAIYRLKFSFPVSKQDEITYKLSPFKFNCWYPTFENQNDGGFAPINGGVSPMNDAAYFAHETNVMWTDQYKIPKPLTGIRIFTHVDRLDDSFACGKSCFINLQTEGNPQIVLGNGDAIYYPLTSADIVAHELGHILVDDYTDLRLSYEGGPISESFGDMTGIALKNYLSQQGFAWYWNGDWTIGDKITKDGKPIRYLDDPTKDQYSIDNLQNYYPSLPAHYASGIYNKAFYLLSITHNWSIDKAYEVFLGAVKYWNMYTILDNGSCGVIQSAVDKGYSTADVIAAFANVGVACPPPTVSSITTG